MKKLTHTPMTISIADQWLKEMAEVCESSTSPSQQTRAIRFNEVRMFLRHLSCLTSRDTRSTYPQSLSSEDFVRLKDWFSNPNRGASILSFTEGPARDAAMAFEASQRMGSGALAEQPDET